MPQSLAVHSFRSFPFIDTGVAEAAGGARHPQQIREIEMPLNLDDIGDLNLQVKTEQVQYSARFPQHAIPQVRQQRQIAARL